MAQWLSTPNFNAGYRNKNQKIPHFPAAELHVVHLAIWLFTWPEVGIHNDSSLSVKHEIWFDCQWFGWMLKDVENQDWGQANLHKGIMDGLLRKGTGYQGICDVCEYPAKVIH